MEFTYLRFHAHIVVQLLGLCDHSTALTGAHSMTLYSLFSSDSAASLSFWLVCLLCSLATFCFQSLLLFRPSFSLTVLAACLALSLILHFLKLSSFSSAISEVQKLSFSSTLKRVGSGLCRLRMKSNCDVGNSTSYSSCLNSVEELCSACTMYMALKMITEVCIWSKLICFSC